ncbi:MAG: hypothetical protein CBE35_02510 [Candidatus Pelagibacter sp. TMED275]|nr:MAG: hypothetical protein CBE35_02510 [Candidatus Pelagibacter sp. TMED275]|tara:strand:- start:164 stop:451 length:288 start_codon:yes stop_codon:yes gene_type:complete
MVFKVYCSEYFDRAVKVLSLQSYISFLEKVGVTFSSSFEIEENIIFAFRDYVTLMRETSFVPPQDQLNPIVTKLEILYKSREELFLKRQQLTKTR